jgi:hypothetical protein
MNASRTLDFLPHTICGRNLQVACYAIISAANNVVTTVIRGCRISIARGDAPVSPIACGNRMCAGHVRWLQALTSSRARHNSVTDVIKRRHILIAFRTARPAARRCSRRRARSGSGGVNPGRFPVYASAARSGRRYCDRKCRRECGSPGVNARA